MTFRVSTSSVFFMSWATLTIGLATVSNAGVNLTIDASFDSIDSNESRESGTVVPPDPDIAVGSSHVIVTVNTAVEIYDKNGVSLLFPIQVSDFFDGFGGDCDRGVGVVSFHPFRC